MEADNAFVEKINSFVNELSDFLKTAKEIITKDEITDPSNQVYRLRVPLSRFVKRLEILQQSPMSRGDMRAIERLALVEKAVAKFRTELSGLI